MTSLPIIWYAIFDFEYEKDRKNNFNQNSLMIKNQFQPGDEMLFMRNPNLYKQGMQNKCFNKKEMLKWINYAIFHALVSYLLCFYAITGSASRWNAPVMSDGKPNGFWVAGHVVYTSTVLISNWTLVHQFHIHHLPGFALICLMWFANFFFLGLESSWFEPTLFADVFRIFSPTFSQPVTWLSLGLMMC